MFPYTVLPKHANLPNVVFIAWCFIIKNALPCLREFSKYRKLTFLNAKPLTNFGGNLAKVHALPLVTQLY